MSGAAGMIGVHPLRFEDEVRPGADIAAVLRRALGPCGLTPENGDILVVTQKIISKAQGRFIDLTAVTPSQEALRLAGVTRKDPRLVEIVLAESSAVVRAAPHVLITRHVCGWVMANAGVDQSNIGPGGGDRVLLLPRDADRVAQTLREDLARLTSADLGLVIADSFGRPWRVGVVNVALGAAGMPALIDRRGENDRDGRRMEVTQVALADMIASAAGLVMGEGGENTPAALIRGLMFDHPPRGAVDLIRPVEQDLFT